MKKYFTVFICFISLNVLAKEESSFLAKIGEFFLGLDGKSYETIKNDNEKMAKQLSSNRMTNNDLQKVIDEAIKKRNEDFDRYLFGQDHPPDFFEIYDVKDSIVRVDSCYYDDNGEVDRIRIFNRPRHLFLVSEKGSLPLTYKGESEGIHEVCLSKIRRKLWDFTIEKDIRGRINLITTFKDGSVTLFDRSFFTVSSLEDKEIERIKERNPLDIETYTPSLGWEKKLSGCEVKRWDKFLKIYCKNEAHLFINHKNVLSTSAIDALPHLEVEAEVRLNKQTYFYVSFSGGQHNYIDYMLVPELGTPRSTLSCGLPTMC